MNYSKVLRVEKVGQVHRVLLEFSGKEPKPGQFVALVLPGEKEIPLGVSDYREGTLELHLDSEGLARHFQNRERVLMEGPFGRPLEIKGNVRGIAIGKLFHDLLFPLRAARRRGYISSLDCESCTEEFEEPRGDVKWDLTLASVPVEMVRNLPPKTLVYVRWAKMNCMMGVCGVCNVRGFLPCVEGPFMEVEKIVVEK